ncbi:MAG: cobalamin-binding protein [Deltaproteobacteria bacterium]|nr:cobalamin-binding protein [Deltaproteobacteria bacterium]MBI4224549.1 cobalamin-binding protein [Deltaproteobacteria bacterium]
MRIASLIASATEIVAALGKAGQLVGVSHECDWPPEAVAGRAVLTRPELDVARKSLDIHQDVQKIVERGLGVYAIDIENLKRVRPDVIITQDQCDVCAVTFDDVAKAAQQCLQSDVKIVTLHPDSLEDIFKDILKVGEALQAASKAQKLVREIKNTMGEVARKTKDLKPKPRVVCLEWLNPLMAAGNWMPEMVEMAGGINGITKRGDHTKVMEWDELKAYNPDLVLVMPCGFKIEQSLKESAALKNFPGKVFVIDGNAYMNRPGPRVLESLYILAGLFWPDLFKNKIPKNSVVFGV